MVNVPHLLTLERNKRLSKGKKGLKKRTQDPFTRKDWFSVKVSLTPCMIAFFDIL